MSKRISGIAGAVAASALLLTGLSTQSASATVNACAPGRVCGYFQGQLRFDILPVSSGQCVFINQGYIDLLVNESNVPQRAWSGTNCTGRNVLVDHGTRASVNLFWSIGGL
ncbi:MAG: hypothetical protein QOH03_2595 [Kribbellaceae bacterium]|nr:hypothetical protein [Kribbellaceae bacterium]